MSRILKAAYVTVDENNRVSVDVMDTASLEQKAEANAAKASQPSDEPADSPENSARKIIDTARQEASMIIESAKLDATRVISNERALLEAEIEKKRAEVLDESRNSGYNQGYKESETLRIDAEKMLKSAAVEREETLRNIEPELTTLICRIVHKLTADAADINPQVIRCLIRQGLSQATAPGDISVHVSGADYDIISEYKNELLQLVETGTRIEIVKDLSLNKADCVIETPYGNIDCSLEAQFISLRENIYYILNNR